MRASDDADTRMLLRALRDNPGQDINALTFVPPALAGAERAARKAALVQTVASLIAAGHVSKDGGGLHSAGPTALADLAAFDAANGVT